MKQNYIYISIMSMVFLGFTIVFLFSLGAHTLHLKRESLPNFQNIHWKV